jgi:DNA (cytosine-5)-methyltransferase 1
MNNKYTFIDLFTGAGGLYRGFKNAGMEHLLSVEIWKPAIDTLKSNYPDIELYEGDIRKLDAEKLQEYLQGRECDVLVGGPPCQGFSTIGKRLEKDPRNELVFEFIRIVNTVRPKFFIMENVKGLLSASKGIMRELIIEEFAKIGYKNTISSVLCAADYNVPQMRQRVFFFGVRDDVQLPAELAFPVISEKKVTVGEAIMDLMGKENEIPNHIPMKHNETVTKRIECIPEGGGIPKEGLPEDVAYGSRSDYANNKLKNFSHVYKRLDRSKQATTMVPGHNAFPLHPVANRSLTVREAARIQTFPDDVVFSGSRQEQCIQVGNAVPVKLAEALADNAIKYLEMINNGNNS